MIQVKAAIDMRGGEFIIMIIRDSSHGDSSNRDERALEEPPDGGI
jgi:hypothetical protein